MLQACDQQVKLSRNRLSIGDDLNNLRKSRDEMPYVLKQLLDATRNQLLTSVNFEQSVIPPPHLAKPEYKEAMSQVWGRAHPKIGERIHRLEAVTPTNGWMSELKHAVRRQSSLLRLELQHASDITTDECIAVLARSHDGLIGSILSSIATAAAAAVGTTECVGSRELGLTTELDRLLGQRAS